MAQNSTEDECICRNIRKDDAVCLFAEDEKRPIKTWHKDCPVCQPMKVVSVETIFPDKPVDSSNS